MLHQVPFGKINSAFPSSRLSLEIESLRDLPIIMFLVGSSKAISSSGNSKNKGLKKRLYLLKLSG